MAEDYSAEPEIPDPLPEWSSWYGSESSAMEIDIYFWCRTLCRCRPDRSKLLR